MTIYTPSLADRSGPKYLVIAAAIADDIGAGRLAPERKLPPQRDLAYRLGVTVGTVTRAYAELMRRGLATGEVGRGTFVRAGPPAGDGAAMAAPSNRLIDLGRNVASFGPHGGALTQTLAALARESDPRRFLDYDEPHDRALRHRAAAARWISDLGLPVGPERIVVTAGMQHALAIVFAAFAAPGDGILMEALTYFGAIEAARLYGLRLHPVAIDENGMDPAALDAACRESKARLLVLVPTLQNPTASVMPEDRRREIVAVARRHDLTIVEDDIYGFLVRDRPTALASLAPERTVYLNSASKALAPGLRVGWIAAPPAHVGRLVDKLWATCICPPPLTGEIITRWIESGAARRIVEWQIEEIAARQAIAGEVLAGLSYRSHPTSFHLLLDVPPPWQAESFAAAARERGIVVVTAGAFAVADAPAPEAVRLSLSNAPDRPSLRRTLATLRDLLLSPPAASSAVI